MQQLGVPVLQVLSGVASHTSGSIHVFERLDATTRTAVCAHVLQCIPQRVGLFQVTYVASLIAAFVYCAPLTAVGELRDSRVVTEEAETHLVRGCLSIGGRIGPLQRLVNTMNPDFISRSQLERRSQSDIICSANQQKSSECTITRVTHNHVLYAIMLYNYGSVIQYQGDNHHMHRLLEGAVCGCVYGLFPFSYLPSPPHSPFLHLSPLPISSYILSSSPATAKESGERLNVASESGRKPAAKRHLVHLGLKEVLLLREC